MSEEPAHEKAALSKSLSFGAGLGVALAFVLAFLFFGGRNLSSIVAASAALAALAAALLGLRAPTARAPRLAGWAALALLVWSALGLLPLPHGLLHSLSPRRAAIEAAVPGDFQQWPERLSVPELSLGSLLGEAPEGAPEEAPEEATEGERQTSSSPGLAPLSFDPERTRVALAILAAWLFLLLGLTSLRSETFGLRLLGVFSAVTAGGAVFGAWQARQPGKSVYGLELPAFSYHTPYATFWNSNHFAGLCAMLCPLLLATVLSRERRAWLRVGSGVLLLLTGLAVLDAGSRGGLLAAGLGGTVLGLNFCLTKGRRKLGLALILGALLSVAVAFTVFAEKLIDESFEQTVTSASNAFRLALYERELGMISEAPVLGHGLGAFTPAHSAYYEGLESTVPFHGEGDWLEVAVEGGLPLLAAWLLLLFSLLRPAWTAVLSGRAPPQLSALVAGLVAVLGHAAIDFHLRESAVAAAALVMLATAHVWGRRLLADGAAAPSGSAGFGRLGVLLCLGLSLFLGLGLRAARDFDLAKDAALKAMDPRSPDPAEAVSQASRVVRARPASGDSWSLLAAAEANWATLLGRERELRDEHRLKAMEASVEALRRNPSSMGVAHRAGSILLSVGADEEAQAAARLALLVSPASPEANALQGKVLLRLGRDAEALAPLCLAYRAVPVSRLKGQAPRFVRLLLHAADGEPRRLLAAVPEEEHRAWYLASLARMGLAQDLPPYFDALAEEDPPESPRRLAALLRYSKGPEAARLALHLLPQAEACQLRVVLAEAMLGGADRSEAEAILEHCLSEEDCPSRAAVVLVDEQRRRGLREEPCSILEAARKRWPQDAELERRGRPCETSP